MPSSPALETLWMWPDIARNVLRYLAATQCANSGGNGAEVGKILNESRAGFPNDYYGVDTTPLFVMLAAGLLHAHAPISDSCPSCGRRLRPRCAGSTCTATSMAMASSKRGRAAAAGAHSWKSSPDAMFHADGKLATGPLALCEVQGYVYAARIGAARIARSLGETARAIALVEAAQALQARSTRRSGAATSRVTRSRSMATNNLAASALESGALPVHGHRTAERARQVIAGLGDEHSFRAGACGRWARASCATTRWLSQRLDLAA
jgi:glycogen debranching enzyme